MLPVVFGAAHAVLVLTQFVPALPETRGEAEGAGRGPAKAVFALGGGL